jgi:NADPH:quinone reductase-like Zn-dependent oxidoreductase
MNPPGTMCAMVLTGHGGLDKLEYHRHWPTPAPAAGEVLVKLGACGLNNTDINTRTAWYSRALTEGITDAGGKQGFDAAETAAGADFSAQGSRQSAANVHVKAARRQHRG